MNATSTAHGRGHGKLILVGEHAVVYGHPAIAFAVDKGVIATLTACDGPTHAVDAVDDRLDTALARCLPAHGWSLSLRSDLPLGRGMGSSAAVAVSLVRAAARALGEPLSEAEEWERVFALEQIFHGTPSGIDQAVSARGGAIRYERGPPPSITQLEAPDWRVVVLDSGACGDTRALVAQVRSQRPRIDPVLEAIGALVAPCQAALHDPRALGPLLTRAHQLLGELGVSTPALDDLVALALGAGALGAKLSGAGGGGVVIALVDRPEPILRAARDAGIGAFVCRPAPADPEPS